MYTKAKGFTLIELIIVIIVVALIAVSAYSRYVDITNEARIATNQGIAQSFDSAVSSANIRWRIEGSPGRTQNLGVFGEEVLDFNSSGWPIGVNKGSRNDNIGRGTLGCTSIWNYIMNDSPLSSEAADTDYQSYRHSGNSQCSYILRTNGDTAGRTAAQLGIRYNSTDGSVTACGQLVGSNC